MTNLGSEIEVRQQPMTLLAQLEQSGALTLTSLTLPNNISGHEMEAVFVMIATARDAIQWVAGDAILHAETLFGEEAYQYIEALRISEASRGQYVRVATRIPPSRRIASLSWSHHREVAGLEPDEQDRMLRAAAANGWARNRLAEEVRELRPQPEPASGYVVENVLAAAEDIWNASSDPGEGALVCVPVEAMDALGRALGKAE